MGKLKATYSIIGDSSVVTPEEYEKFNSSMLDIGELAEEGQIVHAVAVIFDLEGFTEFCNQIDSHLVVPEFLRDFTKWLFETLAVELTEKKNDENIVLWCKFPFFAKFMGDGVLFLWETDNLDKVELSNLVAGLLEVCGRYKSQFLPDATKHFAKIPGRLRCGIARGQVIAIGNGGDYVGACINAASRLQKLGSLSFAFSRRGFRLNDFTEGYRDGFLLVSAPVRGIGVREPVFVLKKEFEDLTPEERKTFEQ